jgi:hypothetical protein
MKICGMRVQFILQVIMVLDLLRMMLDRFESADTSPQETKNLMAGSMVYPFRNCCDNAILSEYLSAFLLLSRHKAD